MHAKNMPRPTKHRLLSYESKLLVMLGDTANYSFVIQPKPYRTHGYTAQILSYDGLNALTQKEHFSKCFFAAEISVLLVGDNLKELYKRLVKLVNNLPDTLNTLSVMLFQKYEPQHPSDQLPKSIKMNSQIRLGLKTLSLADRAITDSESGEQLEVWLGISTPASRCSAFSPQFSSLRLMEVGRDPNELVFSLPSSFYPGDRFAVQIAAEWMEEAVNFFLPIIPGGRGASSPLIESPVWGKTRVFSI